MAHRRKSLLASGRALHQARHNNLQPGSDIASLFHKARSGFIARVRRGRLHEVSIPASRVKALLNALPSDVLARLPYPHQAVAVTGQGVAITGAADMQTLGNNGAGVKIGVIDLGFASLSTSQASGDLPPPGPNLSITDYTGTGTGGTNPGTTVAEKRQ